MTGLFFGSFNPIHNGHIQIAKYLLINHLCDEIWFVISPHNPLKKNDTLLTENKRLEILEAALTGEKNMQACDIEFGMPKPSYTIDTLNKLSANHPEKTFALIIGADNLRNFHLWKKHEEITARWPVFVYPRSGIDISAISHTHITKIDAPLFPLSSTEIREKIEKGEDITDFVPAHAIKSILEYYRQFL